MVQLWARDAPSPLPWTLRVPVAGPAAAAGAAGTEWLAQPAALQRSSARAPLQRSAQRRGARRARTFQRLPVLQELAGAQDPQFSR